MTKQELNRDVKRLVKKYKAANVKDFDDNEHQAILKEFRRIYYADDNFEYLTKANVLAMMRMQLSLRAIPMHHFGLNIKL